MTLEDCWALMEFYSVEQEESVTTDQRQLESEAAAITVTGCWTTLCCRCTHCKTFLRSKLMNSFQGRETTLVLLLERLLVEKDKEEDPQVLHVILSWSHPSSFHIKWILQLISASILTPCLNQINYFIGQALVRGQRKPHPNIQPAIRTYKWHTG